MLIQSTIIALQTRGHADMHDLTPQLRTIVAEAGLEQGLATLFTSSSTSALTTIEFESGALSDLKRALDEIAPPNGEYQHNLRWQDGNGHSHLRAALLGPSLSIPVIDGQPRLGAWQQVLFIDFDVRARQRQIIVQLIGE
jgi:secondary thiamine-phosphate synthase enzyme